ncbi:hypothetical protein QCB45_03495 [Thiomicrorhabdus sp. ZW0627]|uniref:hypothetical protein n=1 Tax=Thiomicrorhabdus sp. ZW0627 TaxID=3039774 RepID=UPI0024372413|nr:hypothetical protein [Thiomicrorhabdus sp. ZW0627]MDG6773385.1 hypothetical protein [Thiomicrorhabdus sp. ZW0627]
MRKQKIIIVSLLIAFFTWMEVAQAASISTRVRILEGKVSKHDKKIKSEAAARQVYEKKVDGKLGVVDDLEKKVKKIMSEMHADKASKGDDKRYTYP